MRRTILYIILMLTMLGELSCAKDFSSLFGIDADAPIEATLYGSRYGWNGEKFTSNAGIFTGRNHPEILINSDGGFEFELRRTLGSEAGLSATLYFYLDNFHSDFEPNKVYSLTLLGKGRACIDFQERGGTTTLPSGTTVTDIITHCYRAVDGYIIFTRCEVCGDERLCSGEFEFTGCTDEGDRLEVRKGKFADCRICFATEAGCPQR